jgi:hypothetical protein
VTLKSHYPKVEELKSNSSKHAINKISKDAKWEQAKQSIHIREKCKKLKKILVYTGSIENGMDLMRIEMILSYSERKEEVKK